MSTNSEESLKNEARAISHYLIKEYPRDKEVSLYIKAAQELPDVHVSAQDQRILEIVLKYPWMMVFFDAGLAILHPESVIRRKILIMLAILEASPSHCNRFLPASFKKTHLLLIAQKMCLSVIKSMIGLIVLKSYRVLWR